MYGIDEKIRKFALVKLKKQKDYLNSNFMTLDDNNQVPLSAFVKNAYNNADRYIAEVNHRVYSLNDYATSKGLVNIFLTLTLPTEYHQKIKNIKNNPKFANQHIDTIYDIKTKKPNFNNVKYDDYTPLAGTRKLSVMFHHLQMLRVYRDIPKTEKCYFRVYEPHKDGTPHLHASLFVPADKVDAVVKRFKEYVKNKYDVQFKIETNINNPVAYLMKYILKTFDDLRVNNDNITDLSLWYLYHGITRFYTSRTLVSLDIYRALNGKYTLIELSHMYQDEELTVLLDIDTKKIVSIYDNVGKIYNKQVNTTVTKKDDRFVLNYKKKEKQIKKIVRLNGADKWIYSDKEKKFIEMTIVPSKLTNYNLIQHYQQLISEDFNKYTDVQLKHYLLTYNEMVNREFINDDIQSLNDDEYGF